MNLLLTHLFHSSTRLKWGNKEKNSSNDYLWHYPLWLNYAANLKNVLNLALLHKKHPNYPNLFHLQFCPGNLTETNF